MIVIMIMMSAYSPTKMTNEQEKTALCNDLHKVLRDLKVSNIDLLPVMLTRT